MEKQEKIRKEVSITPANVFETGITVPSIDGAEMHLTTNDIRNLIGNKEVNDEDLRAFMLKCYFKKINPFNNEAYLIVYNKKGTMVVGKEFFFKKADLNPNFNGIEAGVIVSREGKIHYINGSFRLPQDTLIGGWAKVWRKDREKPSSVEVSFNEYAGMKFNGKEWVLTDMWAKKPATMICKVAKVQALREAFPTEFGGLYSEEEKTNEIEQNKKDEAEKKQKRINNTPIEDVKIIEENKEENTLKEKIATMVSSFLSYNVTIDMIKRKYGLNDIEAINDEQFNEMRSIFKEIKNGAKIDDYFIVNKSDIIEQAMAKNKKEVAE